MNTPHGNVNENDYDIQHAIEDAYAYAYAMAHRTRDRELEAWLRICNSLAEASHEAMRNAF